MELVFDVVSAERFIPGLLTSKRFRSVGGIIGRGAECDWSIPDHKRILSNRHAHVSYDDGHFYLTDTSTNGIQVKDSGARLSKGEPQRIEHGNVYCLGSLEIRARLLRDPAHFEPPVGQSLPAGSVIPDDAFLSLDPMIALDQASDMADDLLALFNPADGGDGAFDLPEELDELRRPEQSAAPRPHDEPFWQGFAEALGIPLDNLDAAARQALAIQAAQLLRLSVGGLLQSLRTRSELKNELRLPLTRFEGTSSNPLRHAADAGEALAALLRPTRPGQLPSELALQRSYRDLQAHQVALFAASRAAVQSLFEQFAPTQLTEQFQQRRRPLFDSAAKRWRAYQQHYRDLQRDDDWSERLFAHDFSKTYENQARLIATLDTDHLQG